METPQDYFSIGKISIQSTRKSSAMLNVGFWTSWRDGLGQPTILEFYRIVASLVNLNGKYQQKFVLGDGGYRSKSYLLTPLQKPASDAETRYNVAHARARNVIEKFFGMWKRKFSILGQDSRIRVKIETVMTLIVACAVT